MCMIHVHQTFYVSYNLVCTGNNNNFSETVVYYMYMYMKMNDCIQPVIMQIIHAWCTCFLVYPIHSYCIIIGVHNNGYARVAPE